MLNIEDVKPTIEEVNDVIERILDMSAVSDMENSNVNVNVNAPRVKIIEQPAKCALRFRYECEGRSAGSIPGQSTTQDNKTYPTIQILNYKGPAVVVVSCVTKDFPCRPHPHNLVGKEGCKKGVCTMVINNQDMMCSFTSLGIQCVKRKDIEPSLKLREEIKVDPFRTGFSHKTQTSNIDLNVVRLCFQVFLEGAEKDKFTVPLPPVASDQIYDKKAMTDLIITKLSHCSAPTTGGKEIILLCDRVTKDDIQVKFYEEKNGQTLWEAFADFQPSDVHKQVAISFRTPRYYNEGIQQPVLVHVQLRRPSDGNLSESRPFQIIPKEVDPDGLARKRQKIEQGCLDRYFRDNVLGSVVIPPESQKGGAVGGADIIPGFAKVKTEGSTFPVPSANEAWVDPISRTAQALFVQQIPKSSHSPTSFDSPVVHSVNTLLMKGNNTLNTIQFEEIELKNDNSNARIGQLANNNINTSAEFTNSVNNNLVDRSLSEKLDSLDLDIDPNDLMNDINFNNMMVMMDSGNNITFNSSGNINVENSTVSGTLQTPQMLDISDNGKNIAMSRLQNELLRLQNDVSP